MKNKLYIVTLLLYAMIYSSCSSEPVTFNTWREFQSYLYNPVNGATVYKDIKDLRISATFIPQELVNSRHDFKNNENSNSELSGKQSLSFLLTIKSSDVQKVSLVQYAAVENINEYNERVQMLNFELDQLIRLRINEKQIKPELYLMESNIDDHSKLSFYLVFIVDNHLLNNKIDQKEITLSFDDKVFTTGVNHLIFPLSKILSLSNITISQS